MYAVSRSQLLAGPLHSLIGRISTMVQQIMISHYATRVSNAGAVVTLSTTGYYASPCYSVLSPQSLMTDPRIVRSPFVSLCAPDPDHNVP